MPKPYNLLHLVKINQTLEFLSNYVFLTKVKLVLELNPKPLFSAEKS